MGAFSGFKGASRGYVSNPLRGDGRYVARIDECAMFDTESKGEMYKITLTILAVAEGERSIGEVVHVFFKVGTNKKMFQQNLKAFIAGVMDVADEEIGESEAEATISDDNPLAGMVTVVSVRMQAHKEAKNDDGSPVMYARYGWAPSLDDDEIVEAIGEDGVAQFFPNGL